MHVQLQLKESRKQNRFRLKINLGFNKTAFCVQLGRLYLIFIHTKHK